MKSYFTPSEQQKYRGRPPTSIQTVLDSDLRSLKSNLKLKSKTDLETLTTLAQNRQEWREFTAKIVEAAKAIQSED